MLKALNETKDLLTFKAFNMTEAGTYNTQNDVVCSSIYSRRYCTFAKVLALLVDFFESGSLTIQHGRNVVAFDSL